MQKITTSSYKQKGSVLITTLIILVSVTAIAMLSMQKSTTSARMVGNTQMFESTFNAALSELDFNFDQYRQAVVHADLQRAIQDTNQAAVDINETRNKDTAAAMRYGQRNLNVESKLAYKAQPHSIDHTLAGDNSIGTIKKHNFTITITAEVNNANIYSRQEKEFSFLGRKAN